MDERIVPRVLALAVGVRLRDGRMLGVWPAARLQPSEVAAPDRRSLLPRASPGTPSGSTVSDCRSTSCRWLRDWPPRVGTRSLLSSGHTRGARAGPTAVAARARKSRSAPGSRFRSLSIRRSASRRGGHGPFRRAPTGLPAPAHSARAAAVELQRPGRRSVDRRVHVEFAEDLGMPATSGGSRSVDRRRCRAGLVRPRWRPAGLPRRSTPARRPAASRRRPSAAPACARTIPNSRNSGSAAPLTGFEGDMVRVVITAERERGRSMVIRSSSRA